jgi:hypothetical protein
MRTARFLIISSILLATAACSSEPAPRYPSSANEAGYAEGYPTQLSATRTSFAEDEALARQNMTQLQAEPDQLNNTNFALVRQIVEKSDAAGRSGSFARQMEEVEHVNRFFKEEKEAINQKVGGSVQYAAKQKECPADLYGAATGALDKAVEKQLEERLRAHNDAHRLIDDHEEELGKANKERLQKFADQVAVTSYITNVRLPRASQDLKHQVDEAATVQSTLDRTQNESKAIMDDPNATKSAKAAAQIRAQKAAAARVGLDAEIQLSRDAVKDMEQRVTTVQGEYKQAVEALDDKLEQKEKAAPAPATAAPTAQN